MKVVKDFKEIQQIIKKFLLHILRAEYFEKLCLMDSKLIESMELSLCILAAV